MWQLLDFIRDNKETVALFPLSVFAHMAATIREARLYPYPYP